MNQCSEYVNDFQSHYRKNDSRVRKFGITFPGVPHIWRYFMRVLSTSKQWYYQVTIMIVIEANKEDHKLEPRMANESSLHD